MIDEIALYNFGLHKHIEWHGLSNINLLIGENASGKTFVLKAIYAAFKTMEQYKKGKEVKSVSEILADKLYWTFQVDKLGELVKKGEGSLRFSLQENGNVFSYEFGRDTTYQITKIENDFENVRDNASIFIPAKEVLSLFQIILKSREQDAMFGFDDTYLDLVKALQIPPQKGKNFGSFSHGRKQLEKIIDGNIIYDTQDNQWYYKKGNTKFSINITSEGIKKIAIFNRLLSNKYLTNKSILCIDEIEASLHPKAISEFLDMIFELSQSGIQFFITSHSYFVIKKLYLLALKNRVSIPVLSLNAEKAPQYDNLLEGMPDNSIIDEAIQLYKSEVDISLGEDSDA